jgi:hypothetical protein
MKMKKMFLYAEKVKRKLNRAQKNPEVIRVEFWLLILNNRWPPDKAQYNRYDGNNQQHVDKSTCRIHEYAQCPTYDQDNGYDIQ